MMRSAWSIAACPLVGVLLCCQQAEVAPAPSAEAKTVPETAPESVPEPPVAGRVAVTITYCIP